MWLARGSGTVCAPLPPPRHMASFSSVVLVFPLFFWCFWPEMCRAVQEAPSLPSPGFFWVVPRPRVSSSELFLIHDNQPLGTRLHPSTIWSPLTELPHFVTNPTPLLQLCLPLYTPSATTLWLSPVMAVLTLRTPPGMHSLPAQPRTAHSGPTASWVHPCDLPQPPVPGWLGPPSPCLHQRHPGSRGRSARVLAVIEPAGYFHS